MVPTFGCWADSPRSEETGFSITPGSICSIVTRVDAVVVRGEVATDDGPREAVMPYSELTVLEMSGGARTTGGGFMGGGFGLAGAAEGMLVA